jgi:DNA-directed RNA polymerase specialized sigma24 family protein
MPNRRSSTPRPRHLAAGPPPRQPPNEIRATAEIVRAARGGDHAAWTALVRRFDRRLRTIARSYRLSAADVDDVVQGTWLQLLEGIHDLREPAAIGGWLATTTRRNALRALQRDVRERLSADPALGDRPDAPQPHIHVLAAEQRAIPRAPWRHFPTVSAPS